LSDVSTAQIAKFKPTDGAAGDIFSYSVAISRNIALIGSYLDDDDNGTNSGSASLFTCDIILGQVD
jgi:hypothetical protein